MRFNLVVETVRTFRAARGDRQKYFRSWWNKLSEVASRSTGAFSKMENREPRSNELTPSAKAGARNDRPRWHLSAMRAMVPCKTR